MCNRVVYITSLILLVGGCSSTPERVKPPRIDVKSAANQAMEMYDADHDGKLSVQELAKCPGVLISLERYDANHDKTIDLDEFIQHLADLLRDRSGATQLGVGVTYKGSPLADAKVVFEPEPYLGSEIQTAEGVTTSYGQAEVGMPADKAPKSLKSMKLIQYGTFKVRITHPKINLPTKYNSETTLGYETILGQPFVNYALSNK
jgi:EF hand